MIIITFKIKRYYGCLCFIWSQGTFISIPAIPCTARKNLFIHLIWHNIFRSSYGVRSYSVWCVQAPFFLPFFIRFVMYESRNQFRFCWLDCDTFFFTQFGRLSLKVFAFVKCPACIKVKITWKKGMGLEFRANEQKTQRAMWSIKNSAGKLLWWMDGIIRAATKTFT